MIAVISLLVFFVLALVITRVATVALRVTGLSHDTARFQARSAFSGVGFTTLESEDVLNHPVRRNIVMLLMLLSTAGVVTAIASLLLSFVNTSGYSEPTVRIAIILAGLVVVWALASSNWLEQWMSRLIERALRRWTKLDVQDYVRLLQISGEYSITEIGIDEGDWLNDRCVGDLYLANEGVVVLGIRHSDGYYVGAPPDGTMFQPGDTIIVYGRSRALDELQEREAGAHGNSAHHRAASEHRRIEEEAAADEARRGRARERQRQHT